MKIREVCKPTCWSAVLLLCVVGVALAQENSAPPSNAHLAPATVADFKGKVQLQLPGQGFSSPARGQVLPPDTVVTTERGRILLRLEDGSEILMRPHTQLVLKQPSTSNWHRIELLIGRIKVEIQKRLSGSPPFQIGSPGAVISVRGTRFYVEVYKDKVTEVDVEEGAVELESAKGIGSPILIRKGFSSRVHEDSAPEPPQPTQELQRQSERPDVRGNTAGRDRDNGLGGVNPPANLPESRGGRKPR
jgi:hypothetical protein